MFRRLRRPRGAPPAPPWHLQVTLWPLIERGIAHALGAPVPLMWYGSDELAGIGERANIARRPIVDEYHQIPGHVLEISVIPGPLPPEPPRRGWLLDAEDKRDDPPRRGRPLAAWIATFGLAIFTLAGVIAALNFLEVIA